MWQELIKTKAGEEFIEWLDMCYDIKVEDSLFVMYEYADSGCYATLTNDIITNLAIIWLDLKEVYLSIIKRKRITKDPLFYFEIEYGRIEGCGFDKTTRREAILDGVMKAFKGLNDK